MKKLMVFALGLAINFGSYASEEYWTFDNFQTNQLFYLYHHDQHNVLCFASIGGLTSIRIPRSKIITACQEDAICRIDINHGVNPENKTFASLYIDTESNPLKIIRYKTLETAYFKIAIDEINNYITLSSNFRYNKLNN